MIFVWKQEECVSGALVYMEMDKSENREHMDTTFNNFSVQKYHF